MPAFLSLVCFRFQQILFLKVPPFAVDLAVEFVNLLAAFDHELVRVWARERRGGQAAATTEERK